MEHFNLVFIPGELAHYEIIDSKGRIVETFDMDEHWDALAEVDRLNTAKENEIANEPLRKTYSIRYLKARSRWITKKGTRLQVPIEDSYPVYEMVNAANELAAINLISDQPGYLITNVQVG